MFPPKQATSSIGEPEEGGTLNYKSSFAVLVLTGSAIAHAASPEQCNLALVSSQLPKSEKICDSKAVADLAKQGHVYEQNQMGLGSMLVIGPGADIATAVQWFEKSAQKGYAPAQVNLAVLHINGWGVPQNFGIAQRWLREAAAQHFAPAYYNLGELYLKGTGVKQDYTEARRWFQLGADAGDTYAQTNLGYLYDHGLGVPANLVTAAAWYRKAADAGNPMAQSNLADLYEKGEGVPRDPSQAYRLFRQAAEKGHTGAQIQLAYRLAYGSGTAKNPESALAWVTAAVASGDNRGQALLQTLRTQLQPDQQKRASEAAVGLRASTQIAAKSALLRR